MKISVIQTEQAFTYDPRNAGDFDLEKCRRLAAAGMEEGLAMVEEAARDGADLIVTIEAFNASVSPSDERYDFASIAEPLDGPLMQRFCELAAKHGTYVVGGLFTSQKGKAYNSAVLFGPEGRIVGLYNKVHLPAGEFPYITPGDSYPVFETEHGIIGMLVCWDLQYPEAPRIMALSGADLIACPTWGWENIYGLCRAYENSVTIAAAMGVAHGGVIWDGCDPSCIVDNMGWVLAGGPRRGVAIVTADVDVRAEPEPQYGSGEITGMDSMRQIRLSQRRPDTYRLLTSPRPPLCKRYEDKGAACS